MAIGQSISVALKQNAKPGLVLQVFALLILCSYYYAPLSKPLFIWFGQLKSEQGYLYSFVSTALFGGLIPFVYLWLSGALSGRKLGPLLLFYVLFWGLKGIEVDFFYRLQAS